jgi:hypothetical protein
MWKRAFFLDMGRKVKTRARVGRSRGSVPFSAGGREPGSGRFFRSFVCAILAAARAGPAENDFADEIDCRPRDRQDNNNSFHG